MLKLNTEQTESEAIVLLHGLFATNRSMLQAQAYFESHGYLVHNIRYPSLFRTVAHQVEFLVPRMGSIADDDRVDCVHFFTHSYGGILLRSLLQHTEVEKLGRGIMLAPPNNGLPLARYSVGAFDRLFPTVRDISDLPGSLPQRLCTSVPLEIGVITATRDRLVNSTCSQWRGQSDHCTAPCSHFALPSDPTALKQSLHFLQFGQFDSCPVTHRAAGPTSTLHASDHTSMLVR